MQRADCDKIITEYVKPLFGFALKRTRCLQDAEDLAQEITLRVYRALLSRDDIDDIAKYIWTIAHNALANYYRDSSHIIGIACIDEIEETLQDKSGDISEELVSRETVNKLESEIAYLSKVQRRCVIAYYYEGKKQNEIAAELGIPSGTVKWHLFEAKRDLKRGMETVRKSSELKFDPIKFALCGTNGSVGTKGANSNFFVSALAQNIEYVTWREAKTVSDIADALGVSPVYVESEADYLAQYGFLTKHGDKYQCNILLDEPSSELVVLHDEMYESAARLFANVLYNALYESEIWENESIYGGVTEPFGMTSGHSEKDKNFFMWALIPYIIACSGERFIDEAVTFEQAATRRPDGGHNICYASVHREGTTMPKYFDSMLKLCGPCWNTTRDKSITIWQVDTEWSDKRVDDTYQSAVKRDLSLLKLLDDGIELSEDEYAYLSSRGYTKTLHENGCTKTAFSCVCIDGREAKDALIAIGDRVREELCGKLDLLKKRYAEALMRNTPKQLRAMQAYGLQFTFFADGWFILHCLKELVATGKLKLPSESQKHALTMIVVNE